MNQRLGLLASTLLALGVVEPPPPRKEVDLAEAEKVMRDLSAAGINVHDLAGAVGPHDFVTYGKAILEVHRAMLAKGVSETNVGVLLGVLRTTALVGETESGPVSEATTLTASEFVERYDGKREATSRFAASFGEPVDSKDIAGGAGKSFEPLPDLSEQKHAAVRRRIDADMAARIRGQQHDVDFTPRNVALEAIDRLTGTGVDWESLVFPERQKPSLAGVDMARPGDRDTTMLSVCEPQVIDLNPAYESGAPMATIGMNGVPLAHVIFDRSKPKLKFNDISTTRPVYNPPFALADALHARLEHVDARTTWASLCAMPREPRTHNRPTQRAAKKARARTKAKRGW